MVPVRTFAVEATFSVVEFTNGIVRVSKLKVVFVAFEVNPAQVTLVVVSALGAYRLLVRTNVFKFEIVATFRVPTLDVVAKTFVVLSAFGA